MISLGVIGCGQWGPNHVRNFSHISRSCVLMCADPDEKRLKAMKETFLNINPVKDYREILKNPDIHAVCISTPAGTHYKIVKEALEAGKDVLCEKPLTLSSQESAELTELAKKNKRVLMVGHVFVFNPGIRKLKEYIDGGIFGRLQYAHAERTNLGPFRYDVNAVWDLASHDVAIFNYLFGGKPSEVSARGHSCLSPNREDLAFITLAYPQNILVNLHVSWLDPKKVRTITLVGDKKMVHWDDLASIGPIELYDKHVERHPFYETFGEFQLLSREGDITIPKIDMWEPLKAQDTYFIDCVEKRKNPDLADGLKAFDVIRTLEAVQESMNKKGTSVSL